MSTRRYTSAPAIDLAFVLGFASVLFVLALALYGPILAPHDPFETHELYRGKLPPFDPSQEFPLGTDALGRDRLSWLLYGARMTLVIAISAAALRVGLGVFLGALAAWQGGRVEVVLSRVALALAAVPATILACLAVLAFNVNSGALGFVLGLSVVGWSDAFHHTRRAVRAEAARPYVESARALGAADDHVMLAHVLPNVAPTIATIASLQISAVLLLLAELALLRLFFGGAVSSDLFSTAQTLPSQPEWSSMLGAARPIFDVYGNAVAVVAPSAVLLFGVMSFNLFGDALARRAQRLDVFHLLSRRQSLVLLGVTILVIAPVALWPSRLASELAYADAFDGSRAHEDLERIAATGNRTAQSDAAREASARIASFMGADVVAFDETVMRVADARVQIGDQVTRRGPDLAAISTTSGTVEGELVLTQPTAALTRSSLGPLVRDKIVVVRGVSSSLFPFLARVLPDLGASAMIVVTDEELDPIAVAVPAVRLGTARARELLQERLSAPLDSSEPVVSLGSTASIGVALIEDHVRAGNVIADVRAQRMDAPIIVVLAPYDQPRQPHYLSVDPGWPSASAAAVLVETVRRVRASPLAAEVVFVAAGAQSVEQSGLKAALRALDDRQRSRLIALVVLESATARTVVIGADPVAAANRGGGPSLAGRIASAVGQRYGGQRTPALSRAALSVGVRAPTFDLVSMSLTDRQPDAAALRASGRALLVLLAYLASHPEQLKG